MQQYNDIRRRISKSSHLKQMSTVIEDFEEQSELIKSPYVPQLVFFGEDNEIEEYYNRNNSNGSKVKNRSTLMPERYQSNALLKPVHKIGREIQSGLHSKNQSESVSVRSSERSSSDQCDDGQNQDEEEEQYKLEPIPLNNDNYEPPTVNLISSRQCESVVPSVNSGVGIQFNVRIKIRFCVNDDNEVSLDDYKNCTCGEEYFIERRYEKFKSKILQGIFIKKGQGLDIDEECEEMKQEDNNYYNDSQSDMKFSQANDEIRKRGSNTISQMRKSTIEIKQTESPRARGSISSSSSRNELISLKRLIETSGSLTTQSKFSMVVRKLQESNLTNAQAHKRPNKRIKQFQQLVLQAKEESGQANKISPNKDIQKLNTIFEEKQNTIITKTEPYEQQSSQEVSPLTKLNNKKDVRGYLGQMIFALREKIGMTSSKKMEMKKSGSQMSEQLEIYRFRQVGELTLILILIFTIFVFLAILKQQIESET